MPGHRRAARQVPPYKRGSKPLLGWEKQLEGEEPGKAVAAPLASTAQPKIHKGNKTTRAHTHTKKSPQEFSMTKANK